MDSSTYSEVNLNETWQEYGKGINDMEWCYRRFKRRL